MAQGYSDSYKAAVIDGGRLDGTTNNSGMRRERVIISLDSANFKGASGDTNLIARLPPGSAISHIHVNSSVSLTTSTLAFGITGTPAKFGAAKAYGTTPETQVLWVASANQIADANAGQVDVLMTIGTAALPTTAGAKMVIDVMFSARG